MFNRISPSTDPRIDGGPACQDNKFVGPTPKRTEAVASWRCRGSTRKSRARRLPCGPTEYVFLNGDEADPTQKHLNGVTAHRPK